ncbi:trans-1,2-dihydrobenzene-1,2-diol dehydrogenase [Pieris rapae]|uniref:trans-1,2-dihydrobenzene-1,2-diol dehydrogenase n=1 Tax=Pieris rapae TaxID=64459 RepID=UPI001E280D33|nr:trans-1,2-dihydrobenzene-1,2-diol dehydrogenase [Pieris rapae]XP_045490783.1 trans-1,2-dihydrobenzene-1,2-diol dehydrogenase [Pieris rapae]
MPLRWGIVSAGKISHDFVTAFNSFPDRGDAVIAGVAARDKNRATDFAKIHDIPHVFDTYEKMAKSSEIDVAYIGALNPQHYDLVCLFLNSGKHVLCEKPLCLNYKQTQSLIKLARSKKLFFMEAVWSRFSPAYIALEKEINNGKLGEIKYVDATFGVPIVNHDRVSKKELGGSALLDIGVYTIQFAQYIFKDDPIKVTACGELNEEGVDEVSTIVLEYPGRRRAVLNINATLRLLNNANVYGTLGRATLEDPFHFPTKLRHGDGKVDDFPLHAPKHELYFENSTGLVYEALEVEKCIREGLLESPRMTHRMSLTLANIEDEVRKQLGVHFDADDKDNP